MMLLFQNIPKMPTQKMKRLKKSLQNVLFSILDGEVHVFFIKFVQGLVLSSLQLGTPGAAEPSWLKHTAGKTCTMIAINSS